MNKAEISKAGFAAIRRSPRRLIANIQGMQKSGKTRLALTARKPIGYIGIEIGGDEGVVDQFIPANKDEFDGIQSVMIRVPAIQYPVDIPDGDKYDKAVSVEIVRTASEAMNQFYDAYYTSLENFATTVVDTGSDLWEILRLANFGRLEKIPTLSYTQLNRTMDKIIDDAFSYPGSVIFIHHLKEKWETFVNDKGKEQGRPSGVFDLAGYGGIKKKVQATVELWRDDLPLDKPDEQTGRLVSFNATIIDSRHNADSMGLAFKNDFTFADIGMSIIGGSSREDWS